MHVSWVTLALQAVNFLVLVWLLHRFLYRPVLAAIARRQAEVDRVSSEAAVSRQAAEADRRELGAQRAGLEREREGVLAEAVARAEGHAADLRARAQAEGEALVADGRARLARERDEAERALRERAAGLAAELAAELLRRLPPPPLAPFLERALGRLRALPPGRRRALVPADGTPVRVVSAAPLPEEERRRCRSELALALGEEPPLAFEEDAALVGGLEIHFPFEILRCSWREALDAAQEELAPRADAARRAG